MKKKEKTVSVHLRIPKSFLPEIAEIAEEECRTQISVIRQAIKEFLEKRNEKTNRKR